jgi:hypothetical protein
MELLKKHVDTVVIVTAIVGSMLWMNGKLNQIEKEIAIIKTVLVKKQILPPELALKEEKK